MDDQQLPAAAPGWRLDSGVTIFLLYFLMAAGGLWHLLGWFQTPMRLLAGPMLMAVALLLAATHSRRLQCSPTGAPAAPVIWLFYGVVVISSFWLEWYGVTTGKIFGHYRYGEVLQPQLWNVPLAIGFAWLAMVLSSAGLAEWTLRGLAPRGRPAPEWPAARILLIALFMVAFDRFMEPAAVKLGYWSWRDGIIPLQNYLAWFVFSLGYAAAAWRLGLLRRGLPALSGHAWLAQILYFLMVHLS